MKQRLLCLLLLLAVLTGCSSSQMVVPGDTASTPKPPASVTPPGDETTETTEPEQVLPSEDGTTRAQQILQTMTLEEKLYQLFCITPEALTGVGTAVQAGQTTEQALSQYPVGGLIYFAQNIQTPAQVTEMLQNTQSYSKLGLFLAVDEEGGTVSRVASNDQMGATRFPPMGQIGATGDTSKAYEAGLTIGQELHMLGFNLDFAPIADVNSNPQNPVIGERAFSSDAAVASQMVAAAVQGFTDGGVLCCLKHFPGHGDTATDSHQGYAQTDKTLEQMEQLEFLPFVSRHRRRCSHGHGWPHHCAQCDDRRPARFALLRAHHRDFAGAAWLSGRCDHGRAQYGRHHRILYRRARRRWPPSVPAWTCCSCPKISTRPTTACCLPCRTAQSPRRASMRVCCGF